jgi:hypothetical protein
MKTLWVVKKVSGGWTCYLDTMGGCWQGQISASNYFPSATIAYKILAKWIDNHINTESAKYFLVRYDYTEEETPIDIKAMRQIKETPKNRECPQCLHLHEPGLWVNDEYHSSCTLIECGCTALDKNKKTEETDIFKGIPKCECGHFIGVHDINVNTLLSPCMFKHGIGFGDRCNCKTFTRWPKGSEPISDPITQLTSGAVTGNFPTPRKLDYSEEKQLRLMIDARNSLKSKGNNVVAKQAAINLDKAIFELQYGKEHNNSSQVYNMHEIHTRDPFKTYCKCGHSLARHDKDVSECRGIAWNDMGLMNDCDCIEFRTRAVEPSKVVTPRKARVTYGDAPIKEVDSYCKCGHYWSWHNHVDYIDELGGKIKTKNCRMTIYDANGLGGVCDCNNFEEKAA